ncbi:MAG TPA: glycosyltransferase family 4 protein [Candidatus Saccharimonadales bacterium]|nr:glycosyltransferase family 4 protein [Candidatus Saccharimonadales bacterium]
MLRFIWSEPSPLYSGRGGSENYTIGQVRELQRRGIAAEIVTVGHGKHDGRDCLPDISFRDVDSIDDLAKLDGTLIFVYTPHPVQTRNPSFTILHAPPTVKMKQPKSHFVESAKYTRFLTNSKFMQKVWGDYLGIKPNAFSIVSPFADPCFGQVPRPATKRKEVNVLYGGRLHIEKGIYTLLEALHHDILSTGYRFSITTAGNQTPDGKLIEDFARHHPLINIIPARTTPPKMAQLFTEHDIVVMPSNHKYWHEAFGMLSVEAQHAGCRVVASNDGGLPETDCGSLSLFEPGNSYALAKAIQAAAKAGPVSIADRIRATTHFTLSASVDALLGVLKVHAAV